MAITTYTMYLATGPSTDTLPPRRRYSYKEKLQILGQGATPEATEERLDAFCNLFAFRRRDAIVTRSGQGPRAWTKLEAPLTKKHVVRHLLADHLPGLNPIWYGARSFTTTKVICIDVDAVRTTESLLAEYDFSSAADPQDAKELVRKALKTPAPKRPFEERCQEVERALRRMGVDPDRPFHVLKQPTPSGGHHYYLFLDRTYHVEQIHHLLNAAGLQHRRGETEFFPSPTHALRLPFGFIPGPPHDPNAWIKFIDAYRNRDIFRFKLETLTGNLARHHESWDRRRTSREIKARPRPRNIPATFGTPKRYHPTISPISFTHDITRYDLLLSKGIDHSSEVEDLFTLGICREGTRTQLLKILSAHLIWFRGHTATTAAEKLFAWTADPRHESKDLRADRDNGTLCVQDQLESLCCWYAMKRKKHWNGERDTGINFGEMQSLRGHLDRMGSLDRAGDALFLLYLLAHAKRMGEPLPDQSGYHVALPINAVVKKWPGCHHTNYKHRIERAIAAGLLRLHKEKWQNHHGPGRARIYHLAVPHQPQFETELQDMAAAHEMLTSEPRINAGVEKVPAPPNEPRNTDDRDPAMQIGNINPDATTNHPSPVCESRADIGLEPDPHRRHRERDDTPRLPDCDTGGSGTDIPRPPGRRRRELDPWLEDFIKREGERYQAIREGKPPPPSQEETERLALRQYILFPTVKEPTRSLTPPDPANTISPNPPPSP